MSVDVASPVPDGYRVGGDPWGRRKSPNVRCLAPSIYWIEAAGAQATAIIGKNGALLIDPYNGDRTAAIQDVVGELSDLPIAAIAYTHHHADHIGGSPQIVAEAQRSNRDLRILATSQCRDAIEARGLCVPPTEVLPADGSFSFENFLVEYGTLGAHSSDNTFYLINDVLHCVDTLHPGQLEYEFFGVSSLTDYVNALKRVRALDWRVLTAGHGDIGWPADVDFALTYLAELCGCVLEEAAKAPMGPFILPGGNGYSWGIDRRRVVTESVLERLKDRWSSYVGFEECTWSHVWWIYLQLVVLEEPPYLG